MQTQFVDLGLAEARRRVFADRTGDRRRDRRCRAEHGAAEDLERVKTQLIAEAIYAQDNQATLARWYGGALTTGLSIDDIRSWPDRIRAVTAEQVRDAAQKWLDKKRSVTGYLIKDTARSARRSVREQFHGLRAAHCIRLPPPASRWCRWRRSPSHAAAKIQHLISPGGIEAWFVQDATVPLIAMEYAFGGGATQDPGRQARRRQPGRRHCSTRVRAIWIPILSTNGSTAAPSS